MSEKIIKLPLPPHVRMDCYRYALYPILDYYGAYPYLLYLSDDAMLNYNNVLKIEYRYLYDIKEFFGDVGIDVSYWSPSNQDEIISIIKSSLDQEKLIICFIDLFHYSLFPSLYHKRHSNHSVPIYGYDDDKEIFYIIDSDYMESYERTYKSVPYEDIAKGLLAYLERYPNFKGALQVYHKSKEVSMRFPHKYLSIFERFWLDNTEYYAELIENFEIFCQRINGCYDNETEMINLSSNIYIHMDKYINHRMMEYYGYSFVFKGIEAFLYIVEEIIEMSNFIRAILYRTIFTHEYREMSFKKCNEYFQNIMKNEKKRLLFMQSFDWKNNIKEEFV